MARLRIRNRPKKPERKEVTDSFYAFVDYRQEIPLDGLDGSLLVSVKTQIKDNEYYKRMGITFKDFYDFRLSISEDYGDPDYSILATRKETDAELEERMKFYRKSLKKYEEWYEKNKDKIPAELERRKKEKTVSDKKQAEIRKLENQLRKLRGH